MRTIIRAKTGDDMMSVVFEVESDCPHVRRYAERVRSAEPFEIMALTMVDTPMYAETRGVLPHAACPIPCAMIKAMEVAADLGLRRDVHMKIERARPGCHEGGGSISMMVDIVHDANARRFSAMDSCREVGHVTYVVDGGEMNINRTFVEPEFRGQGIASRLVDEAAAYGRSKGWKVVATCSYAAARNGPASFPEISDDGPPRA